MTVLDVVAGAVYYTEILSAAVGPTGRVVSQNPKFILDLCVSVEQAPSGDRLPTWYDAKSHWRKSAWTTKLTLRC